jgi:Raf kinase inhibitor-like YbhB/YbcL family protein
VKSKPLLALSMLIACVPCIAGDATLTLTSSDFAQEQRIPDRFVLNIEGCRGGNESPELHFGGAPQGTRSFALTVFDPDEQATPSGWWHWIVYDLPASTQRIARGAGVVGSNALPAEASQGRSDLGTAAYHGPCPDSGQPPHRYVFTLYALSVDKLPVPPEASGAMVTYTAKEYTLAKATLIGRYGR